MLHLTIWREEILRCFDGELQIRSESCKGVSGVGRGVFSNLISLHFSINNVLASVSLQKAYI